VCVCVCVCACACVCARERAYFGCDCQNAQGLSLHNAHQEFVLLGGLFDPKELIQVHARINHPVNPCSLRGKPPGKNGSDLMQIGRR
jgi:hypothetical protein